MTVMMEQRVDRLYSATTPATIEREPRSKKDTPVAGVVLDPTLATSAIGSGQRARLQRNASLYSVECRGFRCVSCCVEHLLELAAQGTEPRRDGSGEGSLADSEGIYSRCS